MDEEHRFSWRAKSGMDDILLVIREAGLAWSAEHLGPAGGPYTIGAQGLRDYLDRGPLEPIPQDLEGEVTACAEAMRARGEGPVVEWTPEQLRDAPQRGWLDLRDAWGRSALAAAVALRRADLVDALLDAGAGPNVPMTNGWPALRTAAFDGEAAIVSALLAAGADPSCAALHSAIYTSSYRDGVRAVIDALLAAGAPLEQRDGTLHETPLVLALRHNRLDLAEVFLSHGARLDWRGISGQGALIAVMTQPEPLSWLLAHGLPVDDTDDAGRTALWHAARANAFDAVKILLVAGADPDRADNDGKTPRDVAANYPQILAVLSCAGADPGRSA